MAQPGKALALAREGQKITFIQARPILAERKCSDVRVLGCVSALWVDKLCRGEKRP
jgi:hypothetical protein